jgi:hypothetical protein
MGLQVRTPGVLWATPAQFPYQNYILEFSQNGGLNFLLHFSLLKRDLTMHYVKIMAALKDIIKIHLGI